MRIYNSLINDSRLIDFCKKHGYKLIFKPHPNLANFIHLFDLDKNIIVDDKNTYQELFNESKLLITDYSSVAFDFSYLKKPVIYYQYSDDYIFDLSESYFDYITMGFGEVIKKYWKTPNLEDYSYLAGDINLPLWYIFIIIILNFIVEMWPYLIK